MSSREIGVEEARARLGQLVDDAAVDGHITYLTRRGRRFAAIAPLNRIMNTFTYAIEVSEDGEIWTPESDAAIGTERTAKDAETYANDVLGNWMGDLSEDARGGNRRIVVWEGDQQDTIDMAVHVDRSTS